MAKHYYPAEMEAKVAEVMIQDLGPDRVAATLCCERGHTPGFVMRANRMEGRFLDGSHVPRISRDRYEYQGAGCCFRAAVDALHGLDVFYETD